MSLQLLGTIRIINLFFFVNSGVLWAGSRILHRSVETVNYLKTTGKQIFYVTNNSTRTRSQYLEKLTKLGFDAEEVISSFHLLSLA